MEIAKNQLLELLNDKDTLFTLLFFSANSVLFGWNPTYLIRIRIWSVSVFDPYPVLNALVPFPSPVFPVFPIIHTNDSQNVKFGELRWRRR